MTLQCSTLAPTDDPLWVTVLVAMVVSALMFAAVLYAAEMARPLS